MHIIIILLFLLVLLIFLIIYKYNESKRKEHIQYKFKEIYQFYKDICEYKKEYISDSLVTKIKEKYESIFIEINDYKRNNILTKDMELFIDAYSNLEQLISKCNQKFINNELEINKAFFNDIDGKSLDNQQRKAVVVDDDNNLILAGAGSGKTLTIAAKIKYLVDIKGIDPKEILLISYTKKAANEIHDRINNKLGINIESYTFHKLGFDIIKSTKNESIEVCTDIHKIIDNYFKDNIYYSKQEIERIIKFFGYYINIPHDIESYKSIGDYYKQSKGKSFATIKGKYEIERFNRENESKRKSEKKTIKGEQVKSIEEVIIANYLYLNGIEYIYEYRYPFDNNDKYRKPYRPDFYLPEYDVYLEHFGINKDNNLPWLSKIEELKYKDDMVRKRELHKKNGTKLIETYSYYNSEGILLDKLKEHLIEIGAKFNKLDYKDIYAALLDTKEDITFKELINLIATFIELFKSNGYGVMDFDDLIKEVSKEENNFIKERSINFLYIVKSIFIEYEKTLVLKGQVDFNDMINESTNIVKSGEIKLDYKYIIIDEYQDISKSRFNLIKEIKNKTNAKLICVGDDWQSIFRFAGSDIDLFINFEKHIGKYKLLKLENTYRNSQELVDIASSFVMKNTSQFTKNITSKKIRNNPIRVIGYRDDIYNIIDKCIFEIVNEFGSDAEITVLGRNGYDVKVFSQENSNNKFSYKEKGEDILIKYNKYPRLKINYLTVHKSKGLEADNVIIVNVENKITGFPNQITDDPILDLVLTKEEKYIYAEERRLFYVALTRSRNNVYILCNEDRMSIFCDELNKDFKIDIEELNYENKPKIKCPKCITGNLALKSNNDHNFLGCSNYPMCDFTSNSIDILSNPIICDKCGGYMVKRSHKNELFLGCTNYPYCKNTQQYEEINKKDNNISDDNYHVEHEDYTRTLKVYIKSYYEKEYKYFKTCRGYESKLYKGKEYKVDNKIYYVTDTYKDTIFICWSYLEELAIYVKYKDYGKYEFYNCIKADKSKISIGNAYEKEDKVFLVTDVQKNTIFIQCKLYKECSVYIKKYWESEYKLYKSYDININNISIGDKFNIDNKEYIIRNITGELIFIDYKLEVEINVYTKYSYEDEYKYYTTVRDDIDSYEIGKRFTINEEEYILKEKLDNCIYLDCKFVNRLKNGLTVGEAIVAKRDLMKLKRKNEISTNKKLWIEGFICFIEDQDIEDEFTMKELNLMLVYNNLMRNEWFLQDTCNITEEQFYRYKNKLASIEEDLMDIYKFDRNEVSYDKIDNNKREFIL